MPKTPRDENLSTDDRDSPRVLRIATRDSPLAMWQAEYVAAALAAHGHATVLVPLVSGGDVDLRPIDGTRQIGVFTKRIQQALVDDEADIAVHSLKDLPTMADDRFTLAAVPPRETVADCLVTGDGCTLDQLPPNAKIGTGSLRRMAQLNTLRPDLRVSPIRGNVQTRLAKLHSGEFDALVLAQAGLLRLKLDRWITHIFPTDQMLPAPGQGALGIEVRRNDADAAAALATLDDADCRVAVTCERTLLAALHGGCLAPIAAHARREGSDLVLDAIVLSVDGRDRLHEQASVLVGDDPLADAVELGMRAAQELQRRGADALIQLSRQTTSS